MKLTYNITKKLGKIKPMHAVGQPPFLGAEFSLFRYLTDAHIPSSRLHDVGSWMGGGLYVDIPNLFPNFDADENDPASYEFPYTDRLIKALVDAGVEPFFRLGVTIENSWQLKAYRIYPPKDMEKWARICEHVVRHYNEGWANGYHMGIRYWEIWNEPDDCRVTGESPTWLGTPEEYYRLYEIASNHLKACFGDSILVGGFASSGFYAMDKDPQYNGENLLIREDMDEWHKRTTFFLHFLHGFFRYITSSEHRSPLDFFSWHTYAGVKDAVKFSRYLRKVMAVYGLDDVPDILNEWNTCPNIKLRSSQQACANAFAMMLAMQKEAPSMLHYYDARLGPSMYGGLFNPDTWEPYITYYAFRAFGDAYALGTEFATASDDENVFAVGACDETGKNGMLLIANIGEDTECVLDGTELQNTEVYRIDSTHRYEITDETVENGTLSLTTNGCAVLHFSVED